MTYYGLAISKYATFEGRANRREYWMFTLVNFLIFFVMSLIISATSGYGGIIFSDIYMLFILLPSISLQARRLHDINLSAWWILLCFIPLVGSIILFIMNLIKGDDGPNKYGPVSTA